MTTPSPDPGSTPVQPPLPPAPQISAALKLPPLPITKEYTPSRLTAVPGPEGDPAALTDKVTRIAQQLLYGSNSQLSYHVWNHVLSNAQVIEAFMKRFEDAGVPFNRTVVVHANLLHDALFHLDAECLGFTSKEEMAAHYSYNLLRKLGAPEEHARAVERVIYTTFARSAPTSAEEILMRAGDLAGIASPYNDFRANTVRLHDEAQKLSGTAFPFEAFAAGSLRYLSLYLWRDLNVTGIDRDQRGASLWHMKALDNMIKLFSEINGGRDKVTVHAVALQGTSVAQEDIYRDQSKPEITIIVSPDAAQREDIMALIDDCYRHGRLKNPVFVVPGNVNAMPMSFGWCDGLTIRLAHQPADPGFLKLITTEVLRQNRTPDVVVDPQ